MSLGFEKASPSQFFVPKGTYENSPAQRFSRIHAADKPRISRIARICILEFSLFEVVDSLNPFTPQAGRRPWASAWP